MIAKIKKFLEWQAKSVKVEVFWTILWVFSAIYCAVAGTWVAVPPYILLAFYSLETICLLKINQCNEAILEQRGE